MLMSYLGFHWQSFDMVPVNGRPSGVHLGPNGRNLSTGVPAKRRRQLLPSAANDPPLEGFYKCFGWAIISKA